MTYVKTSMKYRPLILHVCLLFSLAIHGQEPYHVIFDVNDGLPSSEVYDVEIDKFNNLWFSTDRGLSKYNGKEFKNFTTQDGLTDNTIFEIIKDPQDRLWFSCYNGSLFLYDYEGFKEAPFNQELKQYISRNWIRQISFHENGDCIFFLGKSSVLDTFSGYFKYHHKFDSLEIIYSHHDKKNFNFIGYDDIKFCYVNSLMYFTQLVENLGPDDNLIGLSSEANYFNRNNILENNKKRHEFNSQVYRIRNDHAQSVFDQNIEAIAIRRDSSDNIYVLSSNGIFQMNNLDQKNQFDLFYNKYYCSDLLEDSERNIWVTTINKGVVLIPAIYISTYDNSYFNDSRVMRLESLEDHLIASTFNGELFKINKDLKIESFLKTNNRLLELKKNQDSIYLFENTVIYEHDGKLTINSNNPNKKNYNKVFLRAGDEFLKSYHTLIWTEQYNNGYRSGPINTETKPQVLFLDNRDKIWIGTLDGLYLIEDYKSDKENIKKVFSEKNIGRVSTIKQSTRENLLIGTIGNGLYYYDYGMDDIFPVQYNGDDNVHVVNSFFEESDSILWIGTNSGLNRYEVDWRNKKMILSLTHHFTNKSGLSSNYVFDVAVWNKRVWVVSEKGLNVFELDKLPAQINPPQIHFDSIIAGSRYLHIDDVAELNYDERNIQFHFNANAFKKNNDYEFYKYSLVESGKDTLWDYTGNNSVQFTNLSPGKYEFIVSARNQINNWSQKPASLKFEVKPSFRQTIGFKILVVLGIMAGTLLIYWLRSRQILLKEVQKRKLQSFEMRAQKAELDALRGQMNPHFVYNALNSIQNFIFKGDKERANYYLTRFSKLMRNSLEMSKLELITISDEIEFLKNYLQLEQMRFEDKFIYEINTSGLDKLERKIPPLLIQPLVENSIKHGFKNIEYPGVIFITIETIDNRILVKIIDNGNGFDTLNIKDSTSNKHKSLSIQIINERLQIINSSMQFTAAKLEFYSPAPSLKSGKGTEIILSLPFFN